MVKRPKEAPLPDEETEDVIRLVADRLAAARKQRGLTQSELGALAELSQQRIFDLEQGTANVTVRTLVRMAKVLDIDVGELFSGVGTTIGARLEESFAEWVKTLKERDVQDRERRAQDENLFAKIDALLERAESVVDQLSLAKKREGDHPSLPSHKKH